MGDGSPFKESGSSLLQNVAKKLEEREQEMKQKYIDLKKKYEDDTLKLKQKENEIDELKKVNLECMQKIKFYKKRFLALDERVFILEEMAKDFKSGNLEDNNNKQQKDFAAPDESSSGLPLSNKKRDSDKRTKPGLPEIIEIDDDEDDDTDDVPISTLKRKRDSNEVKKEHNSDDNDLDYKSTSTTNRGVLKEIKRECNSDYVDKIPTGTQSRGNLGELHSQQLTSQALYSPHSEVKPNASSFNTSRSTSGQDNDKVDETYKYVLAKLKKEKEIWESEADMLSEFEKNDELSMNAICALYRQRTNVHDKSDISRINQLARLLFDGDSQKNLRKTASELNRLDLHHIRMLAKKYSVRIFDIYQKKIDPFFRPRS